MTRETAVAVAELEAGRAPGRRFAVYRFPGWRPDVFGVRDVDQLPAEAERFEAFGEHGAGTDSKRGEPQTPTQGGLFE